MFDMHNRCGIRFAVSDYQSDDWNTETTRSNIRNYIFCSFSHTCRASWWLLLGIFCWLCLKNMFSLISNCQKCRACMFHEWYISYLMSEIYIFVFLPSSRRYELLSIVCYCAMNNITHAPYILRHSYIHICNIYYIHIFHNWFCFECNLFGAVISVCIS